MSETRGDVTGGGLAFIRSLVGAWDCCGTCAGGVLAARDRARDAAVSAATAETPPTPEASTSRCPDCRHKPGAHHHECTANLYGCDRSADEFSAPCDRRDPAWG